jgi:hypothetical protein
MSGSFEFRRGRRHRFDDATDGRLEFIGEGALLRGGAELGLFLLRFKTAAGNGFCLKTSKAAAISPISSLRSRPGPVRFRRPMCSVTKIFEPK